MIFICIRHILINNQKISTGKTIYLESDENDFDARQRTLFQQDKGIVLCFCFMN